MVFSDGIACRYLTPITDSLFMCIQAPCRSIALLCVYFSPQTNKYHHAGAINLMDHDDQLRSARLDGCFFTSRFFSLSSDSLPCVGAHGDVVVASIRCACSPSLIADETYETDETDETDEQVVEEFELPQLTKLQTNIPKAEDIQWCGFLEQYDEQYDRITSRTEKKLQAS